jgi:CubicO group peptidase (beta-lactamase class C family)
VRAFEKAKPLWAPGEAYAYHTLSFGWLVGEVVRRVSGCTVGEFLRKCLADPLGIDTWIGIPSGHRHRLAEVVTEKEASRVEPRLAARPPLESVRRSAAQGEWEQTTLGKAFEAGIAEGLRSDYRCDPASLEIPAVNCAATARALAKIYATVLGGRGLKRLVSPGALEDALRLQSAGAPWHEGAPYGYRWGTGFMLNALQGRSFLSNASFGHDGAGGSLAFGDVSNGVGFGFVTNEVTTKSYRFADRLVDVLAKCLRS